MSMPSILSGVTVCLSFYKGPRVYFVFKKFTFLSVQAVSFLNQASRNKFKIVGACIHIRIYENLNLEVWL